MKLRNKKSGVIAEFGYIKDLIGCVEMMVRVEGKPVFKTYDAMIEIMDEWEDYDDHGEYWTLDGYGEIMRTKYDELGTGATKRDIELGNYFKSRKEAERAVNKLKAFKKLKDLGFRFDGIRFRENNVFIKVKIDADHEFTDADAKKFNQLMHFVFGGDHGRKY